MIEKGNINLGLVASIVIGLLIGYLLIAAIGKFARRDPAPAPAPKAKVADPIGFKADEPLTTEPEPPEKTDE